MVSAPYGQAFGAALQRGSDESTGVIYVCPIGPGICSGLNGTGTGVDRRLYDVDG